MRALFFVGVVFYTPATEFLDEFVDSSHVKAHICECE